MSAKEVRQAIETVTMELGIIRLNTLNDMARIRTTIGALQAIDSNRIEVSIALANMRKIERDLLEMTEDLDVARTDLDNYRWSL